MRLASGASADNNAITKCKKPHHAMEPIGPAISHDAAVHPPCKSSVERLEFVRLDRRLILVQVREGILSAVVMCVIVRIDGLRLKTSNRVELLDRRCSKTCQRTKYCSLDLCHLGILNSIHQGVLCFRSV